jgi:rubrerythrin
MSTLSDGEASALRDALEDEYHAWATYDQVIADFGAVRPFINIREAEARHIAALRELFERYGLPFPENPWPGRVARYSSVREACAAAVAAEVENGRLYERLLASARLPDVRGVFQRLKEASEERHLYAFRRCVERMGRRQGR